jgi:hypothetical protein
MKSSITQFINMKKVIFGLITIFSFFNLSFGQTFEESKNHLSIIQKKLKVENNINLILIDKNIPAKVKEYLANLENSEFYLMGSSSHSKIENLDSKIIFDVYTLQSKKDESKFVVIIENSNNSDVLIVESDFIFSKDNVSLNSYVINEYSYASKTKYGPCLKKCIAKVLDTNDTVGQIITIGGVLGGLGCGPCGIVSGFFFGVGALGCAGGCA